MNLGIFFNRKSNRIAREHAQITKNKQKMLRRDQMKTNGEPIEVVKVKVYCQWAGCRKNATESRVEYTLNPKNKTFKHTLKFCSTDCLYEFLSQTWDNDDALDYV